MSIIIGVPETLTAEEIGQLKDAAVAAYIQQHPPPDTQAYYNTGYQNGYAAYPVQNPPVVSSRVSAFFANFTSGNLYIYKGTFGNFSLVATLLPDDVYYNPDLDSDTYQIKFSSLGHYLVKFAQIPDGYDANVVDLDNSSLSMTKNDITGSGLTFNYYKIHNL